MNEKADYFIIKKGLKYSGDLCRNIFNIKVLYADL